MSESRPAGPMAAVDVGSNTIHLVVARPIADGRDVETLADEVELVRLGADVNATGTIGPERMAHAIRTLRRYVEIAHGVGATSTLGIATEGVRAAHNGAALIERAREEASVELHLVTGDQEAALTFWGATSGQLLDGRNAVVDLGGGSVELVVGDGERVEWRVSLPLGSGAVHDRLAPSDPANGAELAEAEIMVNAALSQLEPPLPVGEVAACGGTATTLSALARLALGTPVERGPGGADDPAALPALDDEVIAALLQLLETVPAAEITRRYGVDEGRARLLAAGGIVLRSAMRRLGAERLRVSRRGIREGAILAYLRHGEGWLEAAARG